DDRVVWPLQAEADRSLSGNEIDQTARDEERADLARAFFVQRDRGFGDARQPADTRADQNARALFLLFRLELDAAVVPRLLRSRETEGDKVVHAPLFFGLDPLISVERSVRTVAARHFRRDLAAQI